MPANNRNRSNRGYGRPFGSGGDRSMQASSGPRMNNHLELRELDLELALLKRKREMIENQHTMLVNDNQFGGSSQYGFNQGQSYGQGSETSRNFGNLYNDPPGPQYNNRFNTQQGVKRPAIDPWDNTPPKRFSAPSGPKKPTRYEPRAPRQQARFQPASQPPSLTSSSYRQRRPPLPTSRTNFKQNKVTKPHQNTAANKLNSYTVAERKNLIGKTSGLVEKIPEKFLYEADKPPHPKMLGRLELALGTVLREMKEAYSAVEPHALTFANVSGQRAIKQAIRERIRTLMLGKPVGAGAEIVAIYRKEYPKDTDVELLEKARESIVQKSNLAIEIIKQGNPERYFKSNFRRLLDVSLQEMLDRVLLLYKKVNEGEGKPLQEVIDGILLDINKSLQDANDEPKEESEKKVEADDKTDEITETDTPTAENNGAEAPAAENIEAETPATENTEVETPAPDNIEAEAPAVKTIETAENTEAPQENGTNSEETAKPVEDENAGKAEETDKPVQSEKQTSQSGAKKPYSNEEYVRSRFYNRLMENMMKRSLPIVLPRYKEFIMRIISSDNAFKETKAYLIKTTNEKVDEREKKLATTPTKAQGAKEKGSLFVKILGRPALPKKKVMKAFLDTFHPTLIKKHRNMHNILFVSFDSQENFDKILAKNGTSITNCRLDIRVSEKVNKNKKEDTTDQKNDENSDSDVILIESTQNDSVDVDESLDSQITDLLSSIRQDEEDDDKDKKVDDEKDKNEEDDGKENAEAVDDTQLEAVQEEVEEAVQEEVKDAEAKDDDEPEIIDEVKPETQKEPEPVEKVVVVNEAPAKGTPTRSSTRLTATPSAAVRTRRASKLAQ